jgi:hypothetical protein
MIALFGRGILDNLARLIWVMYGFSDEVRVQYEELYSTNSATLGIQVSC